MRSMITGLQGGENEKGYINYAIRPFGCREGDYLQPAKEAQSSLAFSISMTTRIPEAVSWTVSITTL